VQVGQRSALRGRARPLWSPFSREINAVESRSSQDRRRRRNPLPRSANCGPNQSASWGADGGGIFCRKASSMEYAVTAAFLLSVVAGSFAAVILGGYGIAQLIALAL
jgi:hypothetical protein